MENLSGIKTIAFDTDGTLVDFEKVMRLSLNCAIEELTCHRPKASSTLNVDSMIDIRNDVATEASFLNSSFEEIRLESFRRIVALTGEPDESLALRLFHLYMKHRYEDIEVYEDVIPVLTQLKETYRLGLHSNGNSYPDLRGLSGLFDVTVFSEECGIEKPNPAFYQLVIERANCPAEKLLNVGDSLHNDVRGATISGIPSIWLNRNGKTAPTGIKIDHQISTLFELPGLLG